MIASLFQEKCRLSVCVLQYFLQCTHIVLLSSTGLEPTRSHSQLAWPNDGRKIPLKGPKVSKLDLKFSVPICHSQMNIQELVSSNCSLSQY